MNNRFTFKDFVSLAMLCAIIVMIGLKMVQDDRQWEQFAQLSRAINAQTKDIASLGRLIREGGPIATQPVSDSGQQSKGLDIFRRLRKVQQLEDYASGDWMVESFNSAPPKLNYLTSHDVYSRVIYFRILESLGTYDIEKLQVVPHLASGWQMAEDGLSLDVQLRRDVIFSDGEPMDAEDVVYTWQLMQDPDITDGHTREYIRHITSVEQLGPYEVRFKFAQAFYENFLRAIGEPVLAKHFMEQFSARQIREHPALVLGTGPYRLRDPEEYIPGQQVELVRNERYWGAPGPWDRIIWRIIEKESTELVAFRNGEIDMFGPTPEQHLQMVDDTDLTNQTQHHVYEQVRTGYSYIAWNQQRDGKPTVFADKRVRQAMTMLIDRQRLIDDIWLGFGAIATGPFHHLGPQYNQEVKPWPYDPDRAIALLKEAGFRREGDGPMLGPDGKPFEVELIYPSGSDLIQQVCLFVHDNFARAGINLKLNPQKWVLLLATLNEKNFDAISLGWGAGGLESDIEQMFHSRAIKEGDNRNAYVNTHLDALIEQAHVTLDEESRMEIWKRCHTILHEDQPYTFMIRPQVRLWLDKRIRNVRRIPTLGINHVSTWPVPIEWYVPAPLQKRGKE